MFQMFLRKMSKGKSKKQLTNKSKQTNKKTVKTNKKEIPEYITTFMFFESKPGYANRCLYIYIIFYLNHHSH